MGHGEWEAKGRDKEEQSGMSDWDQAGGLFIRGGDLNSRRACFKESKSHIKSKLHEEALPRQMGLIGFLQELIHTGNSLLSTVAVIACYDVFSGVSPRIKEKVSHPYTPFHGKSFKLNDKEFTGHETPWKEEAGRVHYRSQHGVTSLGSLNKSGVRKTDGGPEI
ncbi:hypothetical protein NQZ68_035481 [Dissostichus eleginoides]|nr:hypothetical protein NQZ68_035481 [Dissostichus eleginoides]